MIILYDDLIQDSKHPSPRHLRMCPGVRGVLFWVRQYILFFL